MKGVKGYQPGHEKLGGRAKGTKNKNTEMKNNLRDFLINNFAEFEASFHKLPDRDKCQVYLKAAEFVMPKISSVKFEEAKNANSARELLRITAEYRDD